MRRLLLVVPAVIALALAACMKSDKPNPKLIPGEYTLDAPAAKVWYKVTGTGTDGRALVTLHRQDFDAVLGEEHRCGEADQAATDDEHRDVDDPVDFG